MRRDVWIALFALGVLLFSWPLMNLFKHSLVAYLFIAWSVFVALIFLAARRAGGGDGGG